MPKVWIPRCGDGIRLTAPWTVSLTNEYRNAKMIHAVTGRELTGSSMDFRHHAKPICSVTFGAGAELVFDRVYIRQGADNYASTTFIVKDTADGALVGQRFWVGVDDANRIEAEPSSHKNPLSAFSLKSYVTAWKAKADPKIAVQASAAKAKREELQNVRSALCEACCEPWRTSDDKRPGTIRQHVQLIIQTLLPLALAARDAEHARHLEAYERNEAMMRQHDPKWHSSPPWKYDDEQVKGSVRSHLLQQSKGRRGYNAWIVAAQAKHADGSTERTMLPLLEAPYKGDGTTLDIGFTVITDANGIVTGLQPYSPSRSQCAVSC